MAASSAGSTPSASADGSSTPATTPDQPTRGGTPQDAANRDDTSGRKTSRAKFGLASIVLLTINGIIGSGIFLSPGAVMKVAGTWTPLVYVIAGVFAAVPWRGGVLARRVVLPAGASDQSEYGPSSHPDAA